MQQTSFSRALMLGGFAWLIFGGLVSAFLYIVIDDAGLDSFAASLSTGLTLSVSLFLFLSSLFFYLSKKKPPLYVERLLRGIGLFFVVYFFGILGLAFMLVMPAYQVPDIWGVIVFAAIAWCWIALSDYKKIILDRRFIEREFLIEVDRIVVRQPIKTSLDPAPVSDRSFFGKLYHRFGPYLVIGIPLAYPIQSLLSNTGGISAVLLLLAVLGFPLTLYILGRLTCGAYLWVYKVWQLERQHGKPVVFATSD